MKILHVDRVVQGGVDGKVQGEKLDELNAQEILRAFVVGEPTPHAIRDTDDAVAELGRIEERQRAQKGIEVALLISRQDRGRNEARRKLRKRGVRPATSVDD